MTQSPLEGSPLNHVIIAGTELAFTKVNVTNVIFFVDGMGLQDLPA